MWSIISSLFYLVLLPFPLAFGVTWWVLLLYLAGSLALYGNLLLEGGGIPGRRALEGERLGIILLALGAAGFAGLSPALLTLATVSFALRLLYAVLPGEADLSRFAAPPAAWLNHLAAAALIAALTGYGAAELPAGVALLLGMLLETAARRRASTTGSGGADAAGESGGADAAGESGGAEPAPQLPRDPRAAKGLLLSAVIYYGIPFRLLRLRRFYRLFVWSGALVFDVGAHIGNRVRAFRSLGAEVVALEPQRSCLPVLARLYGSDPRVTILPYAVGSAKGRAELYVSPENPTMSTLSAGWIDTIHEHYPEQNIDWDRREPVTVTTIDELSDRYGEPDFVKIDVEGFEEGVLRGVSRPLRALSVEFLPAASEVAFSCIDILEALAGYRYNYSLGERMRLELTEWVDAEAMKAHLRGMQPGDPSGDIYAVLPDERSKRR